MVLISDPRELGLDVGSISLRSITNGFGPSGAGLQTLKVMVCTQRCGLQTQAHDSADPNKRVCRPRHAVLQTRSPGSAARCAGLVLALRACNPIARCLQPGAQSQPLQLLKLSVVVHGNPSARCLQPRACCPTMPH